MSKTKQIILSAAGLILFLLLWEGIWRADLLNKALLPPPSALPKVFWFELTKGYWHGMLLASLQHYSIGVVVGSILGIIVGVLVGLFPTFRVFQEWITRLLRPVPPIAWIPFAIIWFGVTTTAAAFMIIIGVFWLNYYATASAVMAVDRRYIELANAYNHRGFWAQLFKIILPASAPGILSGVRSGLGQGWMLVVAAELFGVEGVGQRMMEASGLLATDVVVVYMFTIAAVYAIMDWIFVTVENRVLKWQRTL